MDDNLAYYRRFCASRLKRLERCKKTKSFCNLDDEVPFPIASSGSELQLVGSESFVSSGSAAGCCPLTPHSRTSALPCPGMLCSGPNVPLPRMDALRSRTIASPSANATSAVTVVDSEDLSLSSSYRLDKSSSAVRTTTATSKQPGNSDHHLSSLPCCSPCSSSSISARAPPFSSTAQNPLSTTRITVSRDDSEDGSSRTTQKKFDLLREKMISLMENDVRLLQQLLALGDSIQELKSRNEAYRNSRISLDFLEEEENGDEESCFGSGSTTFCHSLSAVTNLYVDDEPKENENKQYFSRKNSVLRIPIPPRSSNRMSTNKKLQRRLSRLSQHCEQQQHGTVESSSQTADGIISKQDFVPITVATGVSSLSPTTPTQTAPSAATGTVTEGATFGSTNTRISNGSIDSGIRDDCCSSSSAGSLSPTLKDEKF